MIFAALVLGCTLFAVGSALWAIRPAAELQAAGAALIGIGGAIAALGGDTIGEAWRFAPDPALGVDRLSGWLLAVIGFVGASSMLATRTWGGRSDGILAAPFVLALVLVAVARDPSTLLAGWELMTLVPVMIVLVRRADAQARRSMFIYLGVTHLGGVALWLAILLAGDASASRQSVVAVLAVVGCAAKAGLVPLHVWLPRAHPIAPPHISALMSGVMVKVALYVLARFLLDWTPLASDVAAIAVIVLGAASGVVGAVYAVLQSDLKRLLAFSTIENVGVIALALGAAALLQHAGNDTAARLALGAALLHATAHAAAKALAFLAVGAIDRDVGSVRLNKLGGLLDAAPWTGGALLLALVTLAGLPPLAGFAGEWAVAQSLLAMARTGGVGHAVLGVVAVVVLAATAGLAVYAAVTVTGLALLGPPRTPGAASATDAAGPVRLALALLGGVIAVASLFPDAIVRGMTGDGSGVGWPGTLDLPATGALQPLALGLIGVVVFLVLRSARGPSAAAAPTWACGQVLDPALEWSAAGFTKPARMVAEAALAPVREVETIHDGPVVQRITYRSHVPGRIEDLAYRPVVSGALRAADLTRRLQTGRLRDYVAYIVAMVIALLLAVRSGWIG
jgi:hydrogenase-4 component B